MAKQRVMRVGNSLGVTIPANFVKIVGVKAKDEAEVIQKADLGEITYKFSGIQQLPISPGFLSKGERKK